MTRAWVVGCAVLVDVAWVLAFAAGGRATHDATIPLVGLAQTAWPFLVALALSWLASRAWRSPLGAVWPGVALWLGTVAGGMVLRLVSGQSTTVELSFVVTTLVLLGATLLGWRLLAGWVWRRLGDRARVETVETQNPPFRSPHPRE
ncbi:DUF3054 domain-containing protein [Lipingzhangella sp. LS1_29]|uniref:DUF3054 domain-containing protein n=1 Tax=Lipingzhangella rawalii TaxID=2055835 RepID=A0ABU2H9W3_9ACTN|nr:DUF3054 domain-containing protein [Lipingzhangella rawalii]MDS1272092.1 DUF3054 domain-containing protein [Lipingzhangella rawalii]